MDSRAAIKNSLDTAKFVSMAYLEDLSDEQLMQRPHPQCNHIKWQLGHLIAAENQMINGVAPGAMPALPAGFNARYAKETAASNEPNAFDTKAELLRLFEQQRAAALAALDKQSDSDLDKESPEEMRSYAPTVGAVFNLLGGHWLMHAGQWAVLRRQLGKPPLF